VTLAVGMRMDIECGMFVVMGKILVQQSNIAVHDVPLCMPVALVEQFLCQACDLVLPIFCSIAGGGDSWVTSCLLHMLGSCGAVDDVLSVVHIRCGTCCAC
jgi:hypothetical protein